VAGYIGIERSGVQPPLIRYAEEVGWTYIQTSEAAELCNLGNAQAYRLLHGLTKKGKLILRGTKRGSYYEVV